MGKCEILLEPREIMYGKSYVMNTGCDNCMWKFGWAMLGHLETMWSHVGTKLSHVLVVYVILASQSQNGISTMVKICREWTILMWSHLGTIKYHVKSFRNI